MNFPAFLWPRESLGKLGKARENLGKLWETRWQILGDLKRVQGTPHNKGWCVCIGILIDHLICRSSWVFFQHFDGLGKARERMGKPGKTWETCGKTRETP